MILAGFLPLSLCDYPVRVAAVVFTQGCNFRCPWCHNGHLLRLAPDPVNRVSEAQVLAVLAERSVSAEQEHHAASAAARAPTSAGSSMSAPGRDRGCSSPSPR